MTICTLGLTYAAAAFSFDERPDLILAEDLPTIDGEIDIPTFIERLAQMRPDRAVLERPRGVAKGYGHALADPDRAFVALQAAVIASGIPLAIVTSKAWRDAIGIAGGTGPALHTALEQWPTRRDVFERRRHTGRAAAALLAFHADRLGEGRQ